MSSVLVTAAFEPSGIVVSGPDSLTRGSEKPLVVTATQDGAAYDLSAATEVRFTLRLGVDSGYDVLVSKTKSGGQITVSGGTVTVSLDTADTTGLSAELHVWDLWVTISGKTWPLCPPSFIRVRTGAYLPS